MKSYKNWKLVNESLFPLGLSQPKGVGGLVGNTPIEESKKKMKGKMRDEDVDVDEEEDGDEEEHTCSCNKNMKKKMKDDDKDKDKKNSPKAKKKKMDGEDIMANPAMMKKKPKPVEDEEEDDDDDDMGDDEEDNEDDVVNDKDDDEEDDMGDDEEDNEDDDSDDDNEDMKKYGFMKKKMKAMKKKMKKMHAEAVAFEKNISEYPDMPQDHSQDSEKEFFASLSRQFGKPYARFSSGLSEDMLVPLNDPNAPNYVAPEAKPGEVGYAPQGRVGVIGSYAESTEFSTLCKYLGEEAARKLYKSQGK